MCIRMYVHKSCFNIYACEHIYLYMYLCNNTSNKNLMHMQQTALNCFLRNFHTCTHAYAMDMMQKNVGECSLHVPTTHPP